MENIHWNKTGALMGAAMALGALAGGAPLGQVTLMDGAGGLLGTAFQIQDDLLNAGSSLRRLGKRSGTDAARRKATFPRAAGEAASREAIDSLVALARSAIAGSCRAPKRLLLLIDAMAARER